MKQNIMISRIIYLILALLVLYSSTLARDISESEVKTAMEYWVRTVAPDKQTDAMVTNVEPYIVDGSTKAYIVHLGDKGFVISSAIDQLMPVYLYCPERVYDALNPDIQFILKQVESRNDSVTASIARGDPCAQDNSDKFYATAEYWNDLIIGRFPNYVQSKIDRALPDTMLLNFTSSWSQGLAENYYCPNLEPGNKVLGVAAGCVAIAMAQIMKYWSWPTSGDGDGDITYDHRKQSPFWISDPYHVDPGIPSDPFWTSRLDWVDNGDGTGELSMMGYWDNTVVDSADDAGLPNVTIHNLYNRLFDDDEYRYVNFASQTYDYDIMVDNPSNTASPDVGELEVAKLCYHAGVAARMNYGYFGSGANDTTAKNALIDHFGFDPDIDLSSSISNINPNDIINDLEWLRPVFISGYTAVTGGGGHAWVVTGYTYASELFRMNFGWGGNCNDWYLIDGFDDCYTFDEWRRIMRDTAPKDVIKFVGGGSAGDGSPDDPYANIEEAIAEANLYNKTLVFKSGSTNPFYADEVILDQKCELRGLDVIIQKAPSPK
jgi:peptidase C10-like protein